jgi:hypothetical protein
MAKAQDIKEHMDVVGSDGLHVGTVDCLKGPDKIVLTMSDPKAGGEHHVIPLDWVVRVDAYVHLDKPAEDAVAQWQAAA